MAIDSLNGTSTSSGALASGSTTSANAEDRFLKLLVAQMKNQDPLNPLDNAEVTSQMAQISTVTGIEKLNTTVADLGTQFNSLQTLQGVALIGREVTVPGDNLAVDSSGQAEGSFELAGPATSVKVQVLSGAGVVLDTIDLGAEKSGRQSFDWDAGKLSADAQDKLRFKVVALNGSTGVTATPLVQDKVTAVSNSGDALTVELESGSSVAWTSIRTFN